MISSLLFEMHSERFSRSLLALAQGAPNRSIYHKAALEIDFLKLDHREFLEPAYTD
jgi:hypothetical protein